jgi:hypothetical protein
LPSSADASSIGPGAVYASVLVLGLVFLDIDKAIEDTAAELDELRSAALPPPSF